MTEKQWKKIEDYVILNGDPLKDVCDDGKLLNYIVKLREENKNLKTLLVAQDMVMSGKP
jgi:hypothetical protein